MNDTNSFMGIRVGAHVRVTCTAPAIELNNAQLIAVSKADITVASVTGERYILPRKFTELADPVNWKRTTGMVNQPPPPPKQSFGWIWLPLFLLAAAGFAGWLFVMRSKEESAPEVVPGAPRTRRISAPSSAPRSSKGRLVLAAMPAAPSRRMSLEASLTPTLPAAAAAPADSASDEIEDLIETRCYGTAIEKLEKQIKQKPDDFKPRLQLLKIYVVIDNRKQADRVMHQIEFHPRLTAEQKEEARKCMPNSGQPNDAKDRKASPTPAPATAPTASPAPAETETINAESKPSTPAPSTDTKSAEKPIVRHAVVGPKPDEKTLAEAAARFGLKPSTVNVSATPPEPDAKPEAKIAETESKSDAGNPETPGSKIAGKSSARKARTRPKSHPSASESASAPAKK